MADGSQREKIEMVVMEVIFFQTKPTVLQTCIALIDLVVKNMFKLSHFSGICLFWALFDMILHLCLGNSSHICFLSQSRAKGIFQDGRPKNIGIALVGCSLCRL